MDVVDLKELPEPLKFVIQPVLDGDYRNNLPTITAVYLGCKESPDGDDLCRIDWMSLERESEVSGSVKLFFFVPPSEEDAAGAEFGNSFGYEAVGPVKTINQFWDCVKKIKCFVFSVSTDTYFFRCRVDTETEQVTDTSCTYRYLA